MGLTWKCCIESQKRHNSIVLVAAPTHWACQIMPQVKKSFSTHWKNTKATMSGLYLCTWDVENCVPLGFVVKTFLSEVKVIHSIHSFKFIQVAFAVTLTLLNKKHNTPAVLSKAFGPLLFFLYSQKENVIVLLSQMNVNTVFCRENPTSSPASPGNTIGVFPATHSPGWR